MITLFTLLMLSLPATAQIPIAFVRPVCPTGFVNVPPNPPYTDKNFCVMKYEAKNSSGVAKADAAGAPWTNIPRGQGPKSTGGAWQACRAMGQNYDLISNDEWQAIARNIADVDWNWSSGTAYSGKLNVGHSDNIPSNPLAASTSDSLACTGTGQSCSDTVWKDQRRTNKLSNGSVIWDFGGNVSEWVRSDIYENMTYTGEYVSDLSAGAQSNFGNDNVCATPMANDYCGFGYSESDGWSGAYLRGADYSQSTPGDAGIFYAKTSGVSPSATLGFRCVYHPPNDIEPCTTLTPGAPCTAGTAGGASESPLYAGDFLGSRYMITKSGCGTGTAPSCPGTGDTLTSVYHSVTPNLSGAASSNDGFYNTATITDAGSTSAAQFCMNLVWGGYDDWYLPASNELLALQTNWAALGLTVANYWSSTQNNGSTAYRVPASGPAVITLKSNTNRYRCVRRYNYNN